MTMVPPGILDSSSNGWRFAYTGRIQILRTHFIPFQSNHSFMHSLMLFSYFLSFINFFLVGGLEHLDYFSHHIGNVIIPTDEHAYIFQRGRAQPPTSFSQWTSRDWDALSRRKPLGCWHQRLLNDGCQWFAQYLSQPWFVGNNEISVMLAITAPVWLVWNQKLDVCWIIKLVMLLLPARLKPL